MLGWGLDYHSACLDGEGQPGVALGKAPRPRPAAAAAIAARAAGGTAGGAGGGGT